MVLDLSIFLALAFGFIAWLFWRAYDDLSLIPVAVLLYFAWLCVLWLRRHKA